MTKKISGVFAPITTPFIDDAVAFDQFKENIKKYSQTPLNGYLVLGSNGESKSLTEDEKLKLLEIVLQEKADGQLVMAGTGYESTHQTIVFSKKAQQLGADLVSLVTPSYFKKSLTDEALIGYYTQVADALSIPVFAYNAPGFTGLTLSSNVIETISQHPNIGGMKDTSPAGIANYLEVCSDDFDILAGSMNTLFIGLSLGASGGVISLANAFPEPCCQLYDAFIGGDVNGARQLHSRLFRLNQAVSGASGVAGVKYAMELGGYFGGNPRLPLLAIKDTDKQRIKNAAEGAGLL
ncbi:MAG: dihydrodipicolinate synthase family protein [Desulfobacterales bacterium]|jgi:4-hydroxy-2-oxoglutarate aldolase